MKRKIIKVGTSAAVILPKTLLKERGVSIGDEVEVSVNKYNKKLGSLRVDPEVLAWTEHFIEKYEPLLEKLETA